MKKKLEITFSKETADFVIGVLEGVVPDWICSACGVDIDKHNLGVITKDHVFCGNIVCLVTYTEKMKLEN